MKTPDEIKLGLECCADPECVCDEICPYATIKFPMCRERLLIDAVSLVRKLEEDALRGRGEL